MGTTLTGTTPQDTYDSLIKVTDNGPLSGTAKYLSDGLGNDSVLALSTSRVGINTASPAASLAISVASAASDGTKGLRITNPAGTDVVLECGSVSDSFVGTISGSDFNIRTNNTERVRITNAGNVGIGTSSPSVKTEISGSASGDFAALALTNTNQAGTADAATLSFKLGRSVDSFLFTVPAIKFVKEQQWTSTGSTVDGALTFSTIENEATSEVARLTSNKFLRMATGTGGIQFNGDTAAANALDDYEEGTWTMGVSFGGASAGVTYSSNTGTYTKIGRQVTVNGYLLLSNKGSSTGSARITGLPFTIGNGNEFQSVGSMRTENITFADVIQSNAVSNGTTMDLTETTNAGIISGITDADFANNSAIFLSFTYFV